MTSNETRLTLAISDIITSEGHYFNLSQNNWFRKVLDLARNLSKGFQHPSINPKSKDLLNVIQDDNMEIKLSLIKK